MAYLYRMKRTMLFCVFLFCGCLLSVGHRASGQDALQAEQAPGIYFNTLGKAQGLTSGKVRHIMQDRQGFVWLVTTAGIERFDGYTLSHLRFPGNPELSALADQETRACLQDKQGRFWILTDHQGLFCYDPYTGDAQHYLHDKVGDWYLIDFILDRKGKYLWIATNKGLARFDVNTKKTDVFLENTFFLTVFEDREGMIWAGTFSDGIRSIDPTTLKVEAWTAKKKDDHKAFPGFYCRSIVQDINGDLLFASDNGFFRMNLRTRQTTGYFNDPAKPGSFPGRNVSHLLVDSRGQLWIGTFGGGLVLFDRHTDQFYHFQRKPGAFGSLAGDEVMYLFEDASGQIWVGDHAKGVSYFNGNAHFMHHIKAMVGNGSPPFLAKISCLLPVGNTLWMGTKEHLAAWLPASGQLTTYPQPAGVTCLLRLPSGHLLAGTRSGVRQFNPQTGRFTSFRSEELPLREHVLSMMLAGDTAMWLSTTDGKLWQFNLNTSRLRRFETENKIPIRSECNVMMATSAGRLCFGSYGGFGEYDAALDSFVSNRVPGYHSQEGNAVTDIAEDDFGNLWIARYGGGLDVFDPLSRRYRHFGTEDGLPDKFCQTVQRDGFGHIWLGTENGLVVFAAHKRVFDPAHSIHFKVFQTDDGLFSNQVSHSAALLLQQNNAQRPLLYFGGADGLTQINPKLLEFSKHTPVPTLTALHILNELQAPGGDILPKPIETLRELVLRPRQNFFMLEFSALNFLPPGKNHYRYLLKGYDREWVEAGTRHFANYTNVPPGTYTFQFEAFDNDGIAAAPPQSLTIKVLPDWYQAWWFYLLVVLAAVAMVYAYVHWRLAQLRKMETMRQALAADLHDEVGASLTSVQILAQLAAHGDPKRRSEALEKLPEQVRHTSSSLREIVWNIQPGNDDLNLLAGQLMRYAGEFLERADIRYDLHADEFPGHLRLDAVAKQHLARIFKEALNNVAKHSGADFAEVVFKQEKNKLLLTIRDQGRGFDPAAAAPGNGLNNMQLRAQLAGGSLDIDTRSGQGVRLALRLPLRQMKKWYFF